MILLRTMPVDYYAIAYGEPSFWLLFLTIVFMIWAHNRQNNIKPPKW